MQIPLQQTCLELQQWLPHSAEEPAGQGQSQVPEKLNVTVPETQASGAHNTDMFGGHADGQATDFSAALWQASTGTARFR